MRFIDHKQIDKQLVPLGAVRREAMAYCYCMPAAVQPTATAVLSAFFEYVYERAKMGERMGSPPNPAVGALMQHGFPDPPATAPPPTAQVVDALGHPVGDAHSVRHPELEGDS